MSAPLAPWARHSAENCIPAVSVADLPPEARGTLARIKKGGASPYKRDGACSIISSAACREAFHTVLEVLEGVVENWREQKKPFWVCLQCGPGWARFTEARRRLKDTHPRRKTLDMILVSYDPLSLLLAPLSAVSGEQATLTIRVMNHNGGKAAGKNGRKS